MASGSGMAKAGCARGLGAALLLAGLLVGCGTPTHRPSTVEYNFQMAAVDPLAVWQQRLGEHLVGIGDADPAALSQLPVLRSPSVLRPARIVFSATEIDSAVAERDGYDVFGLLLDRQPDAGGSWFIFIVGTVERSDYRPAAIRDVRLVAMSMRGGSAVWITGPADAQALARYAKRAAQASVLRFPADHDEFRSFPCAAGLCVEETGSGARWSIDLARRPPAATGTGRGA
jgi:hypothetical protein